MSRARHSDSPVSPVTMSHGHVRPVGTRAQAFVGANNEFYIVTTGSLVVAASCSDFDNQRYLSAQHK